MFFNKSKGIEMTAAQEVQNKMDSLTKKISELGIQISSVQDEIKTKRQEASEKLLLNRSTDDLEDDLVKLESRLKTLEGARQVAKSKLSEENGNIVAARKTDATVRLAEIRKEIEEIAVTLENYLLHSIEQAETYERLLDEGYLISTKEKVPLSPIGSWINAISRLNLSTPIDSVLKEVLSRLKQHKTGR